MMGYESMKYNRCGVSGLKLPAMSFGLWHNFGGESDMENQKEMILKAFEMGITHFDLANNYGPPPGTAEENFGKILKNALAGHRDELLISTKAGYDMWHGPYGDGGSRKYLMSSLDQSLKRMKLDYVDIFYHHRPDPETPLQETVRALADTVHRGKALYVGLSNYGPEQLTLAAAMLKEEKVPCLIHQHKYSMLSRDNESLIPVLKENGIGSIAFCPLEQGLLTGKYIDGIPKDSRAAGTSVFLSENQITETAVEKTRRLNRLAESRGQTLAQMALVWALEKGELTSLILGASRVRQLEENVKALSYETFTEEELTQIDDILNGTPEDMIAQSASARKARVKGAPRGYGTKQ